MAEFEAELGDNADGEDVFTAEVTEPAKAKDGEESWLNSDRDYTYSEVRQAVFL
jgi:translation initiation factor 2 subunit 2